MRLGAKIGEKRKLGWRKNYLAVDAKVIERIIHKRRLGRSFAEIADDLNLSKNKVFRLAKRYSE